MKFLPRAIRAFLVALALPTNTSGMQSAAAAPPAADLKLPGCAVPVAWRSKPDPQQDGQVAPQNELFLGPAGKLLWNGVAISADLAKQFLEITRTMAPPPTFVVGVHPEARCAEVQEVLFAIGAGAACIKAICMIDVRDAPRTITQRPGHTEHKYDHGQDLPAPLRDRLDRLKAQLDIAYYLGKIDETLSAAQKIVETLDHEGNNGGPAYVKALSSYASWLRIAGKVEVAEEPARAAYELAGKLFRTSDPTLLDTMNSLGLVLTDLGNNTQAGELMDRVLEERRRERGSATGGELATALNNLALVRSRQGRWQEAEKLYLEALAISRSRAAEDIRAFDDPATQLGNLADLWRDMGLLKKSEEAAREGLSLRRKRRGENHPSTTVYLNQLGLTLMAQGRFVEAEQVMQQALAINRAAYGEAHPNFVTDLDNLAQLYQKEARLEEAEKLSRHALLVRKSHIRADVSLSLNNLGNLLLRQNRLAEAEAFLRESVVLDKAVLGKQHPDYLVALQNLGELLSRQGKVAEAETIFREVVRVRRQMQGPAHIDVGFGLLALAENHNRQKNYHEAERLYGQGLDILTHSGGWAYLDAAWAPRDRARNLLEGRLGPRLAYELALSAADASRERRLSVGSSAAGAARASRLRDGGTSFSHIVADAAWSLNATGNRPADLRAQAILALQEASASSTSQAVAHMVARRRAADGLAELAFARQQLEQRWSALDGQVTSELAEVGKEAEMRRQHLTKARAEVEAGLVKADERLRKEYPDYFSFVRQEPVSTQKMQEVLKDDEAALLIVSTDMGTHVAAITSRELKWLRTSSNAEALAGKVKKLRLDIEGALDGEKVTTGTQSGSFDRTTAYELYRELIEPFDALLAGKSHVYVAASGALSTIPLGVLVTRAPQGSDADESRLRETGWLADSYALIQIPSWQSFHALRQLPSKGAAEVRNVSFAGWGDPLLGETASSRGRGGLRSLPTVNAFSPGLRAWGSRAADLNALRTLPRLPGTAAELEAMRVEFGAPRAGLRLREDATEASVKAASGSGELAKIRILAFATHGLTAGSVATEPSLVLTLPSTGSEEDDGLLTATEIAQLQLGAEWVILSACDTAAGDGTDGAAGLSGLARAFFFAGAPTILASHWPVYDDVAARLTVDTIKIHRSGRGISRAQALQVAMRSIREEFPHPSAWAPFSLVGEAR